jgi:regulator of replication initiation timing
VFEDYVEKHESSISKEVSTKSVRTESITLGENKLKTSDGTLLLGEEKLAFKEEIPNIVLMDNKTFSDKDPSELDENSYYYIFDEGSYVLDSDFAKYKENQRLTLNNLNEELNANKRNIGTLLNLSTDNKSTLVESINELCNKINALTKELDDLKQKLPSSELPN